MSVKATEAIQRLDPLRFPLHGSRLIEASAGTGKTFTIAFLYVRLVLGHRADGTLGAGLTPPDILVVTFTDAAAKELRDRIRARLVEAAACFSASQPSATQDPLLLCLRQDIPANEWAACARKLQRAAEWMDEAAVSTIHAWCNRMLGEHAFASGSFFRQTLQTDLSAVMTEAVRDYWRTHVYQLDRTLVDEIHEHWKTPNALLADIVPRLGIDSDSEQDDADASLVEIISRINAERLQKAAAIKTPWREWLPDLENRFAAALPEKVFDGRKLRTDTCKRWLLQIREWLEDETACELLLTDSAYERFTPDGLEDAVKKPDQRSDALIAHPAWDALKEIRHSRNWLPDCRPSSLAHAVKWVRQRLELEKQRRAELGFDDILLQLNRALLGQGGQALAAIIRSQFPVAMIDEFQDTDPVQYSIFKQIYRIGKRVVTESETDVSPPNGLFLIGDPKQAIYAFRNADIYTYLQARRATAGRHYSLDTNYRSSPAMVNAVNQLFAQADEALPRAAFMFGTPDDNQLPFVRVNAREPETVWVDASNQTAALNFWTMPEENPGKGVNKNDYVEHLSEACATHIVQLLNQAEAGQTGFSTGDRFSQLRAGDIAVLVNKGTEAAAVRQALRKRGVPSVYLSDRESVLDTPQAREIRYWLNACADPLQLNLLRAALATPSMGIEDGYLAALSENELLMEAEIERFSRLGEVWQSQGVLPMLRALLIEFGIPARLIGGADGERQLTDLLHIAEVLQQASAHIEGRHGLIRHYVNMLESRPGGNELLQVRLESDAEVVQVVTVHKSKGLEYPLVFLPFAINFRAVQKKDSLIKWHDEEGRLHTGHGKDDVPLGQADDERLAEDIRKLYVALTRARYRTWVGVAETRDWDRSGLGYLTGSRPSDGTLNEALQRMAAGAGASEGAIVVEPVPEPDAVCIAETRLEQLGPALTPGRVARENWWIASYSAIASRLPTPDSSQEATAGDELATDDEFVSSVAIQGHAIQHDFPRGAVAGVFLHGLLEWVAEQGFSVVASGKATDELRDMLRRRCFPRGWKHWIDPLEHWLLALLQVPVDGSAQKGFTLSSVRSYQVELEFWFETRAVDTHALDRLLNRYTFGGADRPALAAMTLNGMLKGFIDLVFEHEGRYYVLDYKSNHLGADDTAYTQEAMHQAILGKRYDLQFSLYLLALHRLLRARLRAYDYERDVGGAIYFFLRGHEAANHGIFTEKPPLAMIEALDSLFCGEADAE
ncbi:exodeoxyribonuclease V subunit beta [Allohahella sp. A8]|uniref:exodeoxyribonuclease V subunit beta n=1 Tax=Allohahella sp. A8 TaxID=3141461 RepID=UPI003A80A2D1